MYYKVICLTLFLSSALFAFHDADIDGIDDTLDSCPNTPFDAFVDNKGCSVDMDKLRKNSSSYWGSLLFKMGTTLRVDDEYDNENDFDVFANYRYHHWDLSVSNSRTTTNTTTEDNSDGDNDIYLSGGYSFSLPKSRIKVSTGTKIVDGSRGNDYFLALNYSRTFKQKQDFFLYAGYTFSGDDDTIEYEDYGSFSIGTGYTLSPSFYSAVSYNYTDSNYPDGDSQEGLTWYNSYSFNKNIFATASYTYGLDDYSYENTLRFGLGLYLQ